MIPMDVKGITWVGNIYQKFENMCLEVEDMMYEDAVKYIENHVQTVGERFKKFYSDVMQDLVLPPSSCDLDEKVATELPIDQYTDANFCKKLFQSSKERPLKVDTKQINEDLRIYHDVDSDVIHAAPNDGSCETAGLFMLASRNSVKRRNSISHSRQYVRSTDIKSNFGIDERQQNKKMAATKTFGEITLAETDASRISQSCELSNGNQNRAVNVSKPASTEVTRLVSVADCCNEIENTITEQFPNVPVSVKSAGEKEMDASSCSTGVLFGDADDTWSLDVTKIDTVTEQGHQTRQEEEELKLEETCVMVTGDELQLVPKASCNLRTSKKKMRQAFSLSKKSARKQEYEKLALWHGNSEKVKGDCVENSDAALIVDQNNLVLPIMSEPEWELI